MSPFYLGIGGGTVIGFYNYGLLDYKVAPITNTDSLLSLLERYKRYNGKAVLFRSFFIAGEDEYIYSVYSGLHRIHVLRVYTSSKTHLTMKDVSPSGKVYLKNKQVVDKRRHVVYGTFLGDNDPRPDWLLGFELTELFS